MEKLCKVKTNLGTAGVVKTSPLVLSRGKGPAEERHLDALLRWKSLVDAPITPRWYALSILATSL